MLCSLYSEYNTLLCISVLTDDKSDLFFFLNDCTALSPFHPYIPTAGAAEMKLDHLFLHWAPGAVINVNL